MPFWHAGMALGTAHTRPQPPQWAMLDAGSLHAPLQHCCAPGHPRASVHPAAQTLPTQSVPAGQCSSITHSTHVRLVGSQRPARFAPASTPPSPAAPPQALSSRHPARHTLSRPQ
jgi:hypothetical protein